MPIWILEVSNDDGKTWRVTQPYHIYKYKESADEAVKKLVGWRFKYRVTEYRPVEG